MARGQWTPTTPIPGHRHDSDSGYIDSDPHFDHVDGKDPSFNYALVHQEDMARMVARGYVREFAGEGNARASFSVGTADGAEQIVNGQLVLMKCPIDRADAYQRGSEKRFNERAAGLRQSIQGHVARHPGSEYTRN